MLAPQPLPSPGYRCQGGCPGADDARWVFAFSGQNWSHREVAPGQQFDDDIKANVTQPAGLLLQSIPVYGSVILVDNAELCVFAVRAGRQKIPFPVSLGNKSLGCVSSEQVLLGTDW